MSGRMELLAEQLAQSLRFPRSLDHVDYTLNKEAAGAREQALSGASPDRILVTGPNLRAESLLSTNEAYLKSLTDVVYGAGLPQELQELSYAEHQRCIES